MNKIVGKREKWGGILGWRSSMYRVKKNLGIFKFTF